MADHEDGGDFEALTARLQRVNTHRPPMPDRLRRPIQRFFDALIDAPGPPAVDGKDWRDDHVVTGVQQQGDCGACASFATAAAIESLLRIRDRNDRTQVDAGYMHTCTVLQGNPNCQVPADLEPVLDLVAGAGYAVATPDAPYPCPPDRCATQPLRPIGRHAELPGPNAAKAALLTAPIVAELYAWPDFTTFHGQSAAYAPAQPDADGWYLHSLCVVGFNALGWIIKNSFGPSWGQAGFAVVAYQTCGLFGGAPKGQIPGQMFSLSL